MALKVGLSWIQAPLIPALDLKPLNDSTSRVKDSEIKAVGAGASNMMTKVSSSNELKIGKWKKKRVALILFNLTHVNDGLVNHNANPVDGIIGADILKKGKAVIDYDKKNLYLKL